MKSYPASYITEKSKETSDHPFVILFELPFPDQKETLRIAVNRTQLTWNSYIWYPYELKISGLPEYGDGRYPKVRVTSKHADRQLAARFHARSGFTSLDIKMRIVDASDLSETDIPYTIFRVRTAVESSGRGIEWDLGAPSIFTHRLPSRPYAPTKCQWGYGGRDCGALLDTPGFPQVCDKTREGDQGCKQKGLYERGNGLPEIHPRRIGSFPFIAVPRY